MRVFVIILNWNRADDTIECVVSVSKLLVKGYGLTAVIVDNGSSDDSVIQFKKQFPKLLTTNYQILVNEINLGYAGGNNVGIKYALENNADFVMVLNNDTVVDKNLVLEFLKAAKKYSHAAIFSPKIYFAKGCEFHKDRYKKNELGRVIWYAGGKMDWKNVFGRNMGVDEVDNGQYNKDEKIDFATGTCMFIRTKALKKVGLFDERYYMYFEDADLSQRMIKDGWEIIYNPKAKLLHKVAQSSGIGSDLNDYFISRNRMLFGMQYVSVRTRLALVKESIGLLTRGRKWQRKGILDYYLGRFGKGSWK